ncbi:MAG: formylglycine-generating enzyme family protein [Anaerolineales bacterium]|nr:formylglycine-generating enzyme family protein [Anaerolineales bacterium]
MKVEFESVTVDARGEVIARTRHNAEIFTEDIGKGVSLDMVVIPAGSFYMGSRQNEGGPDEHPQHFITIKSFMMGRCLITQGQWKAIMGKLPRCRFKGDKLPVERVSWNEAQKFCERLSKRTGRLYRLPSESQWEYACRAGTTTPFAFGETLTSDIANYNGEHTFAEEPPKVYFHSTSEGGKYPPNAFGLYDMHGNLMEWCADNWIDDYRMSPRDDDAYKMIDNPYHVVRGGSWHDNPQLCRSAARIRILGSDAEEYIGFRVVCDIL